MNSKMNFILVGVLVLFYTSVQAAHAVKPMPPMFTLDQQAEEILRNYPLGIISQQDAFSHHGPPVKKITLPNGNQGWLYKVGEKAGVPNIFLLQFSGEGVVVDVLHKDYRYKTGHSALQYQFLRYESLEAEAYAPGPGD